MSFKRISIALSFSALLLFAGGASAQNTTFRTINLVGNEFSSFEEFAVYAKNINMGF